MASKYTLNDLPYEETIKYRGVEYPIWNVDDLPVSTNRMWNAMGFDKGGPAKDDQEAKAADDKIVVWTDEAKPIDEICAIASEQGGSGTPDEIVAAVERRIEKHRALVRGIKAWACKTDGYDGAIGGVMNYISVPYAEDDDWFSVDLTERIDNLIGGYIVPAMGKIIDGDADEIKRLDDWAKARAQEIHCGLRAIGLELKKKHDVDGKKNAEGQKPNGFGMRVFAVYAVNGKDCGYNYEFSNKNDLYGFFEDEDKLLRVYVFTCSDGEQRWEPMSIYDVKEKAIAVEEWINAHGE